MLPVEWMPDLLTYKLETYLSFYLLIHLTKICHVYPTSFLYSHSRIYLSFNALVHLYILSSVCQHNYQYFSQSHHSSVHQNTIVNLSINLSVQPATLSSINPYIYTHHLVHPHPSICLLIYLFVRFEISTIFPHNYQV